MQTIAKKVGAACRTGRCVPLPNVDSPNLLDCLRADRGYTRSVGHDVPAVVPPAATATTAPATTTASKTPIALAAVGVAMSLIAITACVLKQPAPPAQVAPQPVIITVPVAPPQPVKAAEMTVNDAAFAALRHEFEALRRQLGSEHANTQAGLASIAGGVNGLKSVEQRVDAIGNKLNTIDQSATDAQGRVEQIRRDAGVIDHSLGSIDVKNNNVPLLQERLNQNGGQPAKEKN